MNIIDNSMFNSKSTQMKKCYLLKIVASAGLFIFLGFNATAQLEGC